MRKIREIAAEEENFRLVDWGWDPEKHIVASTPRRDPVEPEPIGTILLIPFQIVGYDGDCDGSLMARLNKYDLGYPASVEEFPVPREYCDMTNRGLYPETGFVVTVDELTKMFEEV